MKYKKVLIEWLDAESDCETVSRSEAEKHVPVRTVTTGFLIKQNKKEIVTAGTVYADGNVADRVCLPMGMVVNVVVEDEVELFK